MVIGIIEDDNLLRKALDTSMKNQGYTTILADVYKRQDMHRYRFVVHLFRLPILEVPLRGR